MNKIITINLGGISIDIEEDAYEALRAYLLEVRKKFRDSENGKEILEDIESRIAEMLFEKLKGKKSSINLSDVDGVIHVMGNPSDFETEGSEQFESDTTTYNRQKRLFRDPDHALLGGVCSGLSKYLGLDVTLVRIIWLILVFIFGTGVLFYFILWVIIPKATTTAEKLQMSGEIPNIENIKKTIRDEANQAYSTIRKKAQSDDAVELRTRVEDFFRKTFRFLGKFLSLSLILGLMAFIIVFIIHFFTGEGIFTWFWNADWSNQINLVFGNSLMFWIIKISLFGIVFLPTVMILINLMAFLLSLPKPHINVRRTVWTLWMLCFAGGIGGVAYSTTQFRSSGEVRSIESLAATGDTLKINYRNHGSVGGSDIRLILEIEPTESAPYLEIRKKSRGRSSRLGEQFASRIKPLHQIRGTNINFFDSAQFQPDDIGYIPEIRYTLFLPEGQLIYLDPTTSEILHHVMNVQNLYVSELAGRVFRMTSNGLDCLNCRKVDFGNSEKGYSNIPLSEFRHLVISDAFRVRIVEGESNYLAIPSASWTEHLQTDQNGDKVEISLKDELEMLFKGKESGLDEWVVVHASNLRKITANGSIEIDMLSAEKNRDLEISLNGASDLTIHKINLDNLKIEANGASSVELEGRTSLFELKTAGASKVRAVDLISDYLNAEVNGAGDCEVYVLRELDGEVNGAGKIRYKGDPKLKQKVFGISKVEKW